MPENHLPGNPFAVAPLAPPAPARPKHKTGNPFADPAAELDTFPDLTPAKAEAPAAPAAPGQFDPLWLSRQIGKVATEDVPEFVKGAGEGLATMAARVGAGIVRVGSSLSPVTVLDPTDPQRQDALPVAMDTRRKAGEDLAGNIRKVGREVTAKIPFAKQPTTGQKVARVAGDITGQLAPFVAAGPLGLAAGSGLNAAAEVGATPEESLLGMFSKEQAKSPLKRGAAALLGDAAIAAPLHYGSEALKDYLRAKTAASPEELARIGEAVPGAAPAPEAPALPPSAPPAPKSRSGAVGNQPRGPLPLKEGPNGPVVDLSKYPLEATPAGERRLAAVNRYAHTTRGGIGELQNRSWIAENPVKDESTLSDRILTGEQRRLLDVAHDAADASPSGGIVVDPGAKKAESVAAKIVRTGADAQAPLQGIGDLNRASIIVQHPLDAGPVVSHLEKQGWVREMTNYFHKPGPLGHGAVNLQLVDPVTGQAAELQIHTPQTWKVAQEMGAHDIYDYLASKNGKVIRTPADHEEARRLIEYSRGITAEANTAAMQGRPVPNTSPNYQVRMGQGGRWNVEERAPEGSLPGTHGAVVAEAANPFEARAKMKKLDAAQTRAGYVPQDVPHGNYPQSDVEKPAEGLPEVPPLNPFREQHPPAESKLGGPIGHEDVTFFGQRAVRTRYRVIDAGSAVPSNNPHTFERNPAYPQAVQGRVYHGSAGKGAAEQVVGGAMNMDVRRIVNPTRSIGGPPTVTPEGIVVAGNQRTMMQQRAYDLHPEKAAELKAQIVKDAPRVGIDPAEVEGMARPVLVREVVDPTVNVRDDNTLRELNELSDKVTKKTKDPLTEAMGRARQLKANSAALDHYAATSSPEEPLSEYLQGPNGLPFLNKLVEDRVILPAELDGFRDASTGKITKQGRQKLSDMMSAAAVGDVGIIDAAPAAIMGKLETGTPRLIQAAQTEGWSLEKPLQEALELHTAKTANGQKSIADALAQPDLLGRAEPTAEGKVLARFLEKEPKAKVSDAMRQWAEASEKARVSDGSADMFGVSAETPDEAFARIFGGEPLAGATAERNMSARGAGRTQVVGGNRAGYVGMSPHILSSLAGDASKDPYNYAAFKMLSSMAGAGVGAAGGGYAGSKLPAGSPEERRRNTAAGVAAGAFAGFMAPFTPEMIEDLATKLRSAGAETAARRFMVNASPELVRVKIEGSPSQAQMKQLFTAIQKNPKAEFRWSLRDGAGNEVGSGKDLTSLAAELPWSGSNRPVRAPELGEAGAVGNQVSFGPPKAGAVGNQPEHIVASAVETADGRRFTGDWHSDALEKLDSSLSLDKLNDEGIPGLRAGFETSTGRFVTRDEAFQIARDAGQEPRYVASSAAGKPELYSGTYIRKGDRPAANRLGAVGNQPERPGPRPPTRRVRSAYNEPDYVYWPRNSRASIQKAKEVLNLSTAGLDRTATARIRTLIASGLDKGTIDKGYRSFEEMDLSTASRKRELLKDLVEDPNTLVGRDKLEQIPADDIKAMWMIAHDNTKTIEAAARVMNDPLASEAERLSAAELHDKAYKQTEELLSRIVTGTAQKGRELGALRNIAKQSTDPEVWLVQAKRMLGDRPLPDAVQANIRQLARRAQEACL